jgi:hypothetical protein
MKRLLHALAALPFLATAASAQPMQLTDNQMDKVTAGLTLSAGFGDIRSVLPFNLALLNLTFIAPIVAEDTAFQTAFQGGVTLVTLERRF